MRALYSLLPVQDHDGRTKPAQPSGIDPCRIRRLLWYAARLRQYAVYGWPCDRIWRKDCPSPRVEPEAPPSLEPERELRLVRRIGIRANQRRPRLPDDVVSTRFLTIQYRSDPYPTFDMALEDLILLDLLSPHLTV